MSSEIIPKIYTDGSCLNNPNGPGGWCFTVLENNDQWTVAGSESHTTNNRMELQAVIEAISFVQGDEYELYTDSDLTLKCATGVWRRKSNLDLWEEYDRKIRNIKIHWKWVRAHNGDKYNEHVDILARKEAKNIKKINVVV
jgi:ribonuclease HI